MTCVCIICGSAALQKFVVCSASTTVRKRRQWGHFHQESFLNHSAPVLKSKKGTTDPAQSPSKRVAADSIVPSTVGLFCPAKESGMRPNLIPFTRFIGFLDKNFSKNVCLLKSCCKTHCCRPGERLATSIPLRSIIPNSQFRVQPFPARGTLDRNVVGSVCESQGTFCRPFLSPPSFIGHFQKLK